MASSREKALVMNGSVCEDAHSYQDESIKTVEQARANGKQPCPLFDECMNRGMFKNRRVRCAARAGQTVAKYAVGDDIEVATEIEGFRRDAFSDRNPVADFGFIDPYDNPERVVTNPGEATEMVENWANIVVHGSTQGAEATT